MLTGIHAKNHVIRSKHAVGGRNGLELRRKHASVRNNATHARDTNRAITETTWVGRIEVVIDDVQRMYWHRDTTKNESQTEVLCTGHSPEPVFRAVGGALNAPVNRIGHRAWHLREREPGVKDSYHFPSRNMWHD